MAAGGKSAWRSDRRMWRELDRACTIGKKHDAYSVEKHGVRVVFQLSATKPPQETTGGKGAKTQVRHEHVESTCASKVLPLKPNSAQKRSARRMAAYIKAKWSGCERGTSNSPLTTRKSTGHSQVDVDMREARATTDESLGERRGHKRMASETPAKANHTPKAAQMVQQNRVEPTQPAHQAETAWRKGPGLRPCTEPTHSTTCRTCGAAQDSGWGRPCRCKEPQWYERKLYYRRPHGGRSPARASSPQRSSNPTRRG